MSIYLEIFYCIIYTCSLAYCILKIQKNSYTFKDIIRIGIITIIYGVINYFITNTNALHGNWFIASNILCIVSDFIFACILLRKVKLHFLFYTSLYYVTFTCFASLYIFAVIYLGSFQFADIIYNNFIRFMLALLANITTILVYTIISKTYTFLDYNIPKKQYYIFVFANSLSVILLLTFNILVLNENNPYFLVICILILVQFSITTYFINNICWMYNETHKLELSRYANKISLKYLNDIEIEKERLNKFKHDINNHLTILNAVIDDPVKSANYLQKIIGHGKIEASNAIESGNFYVDACINTKIRLFPEISFDVSAVVSKDINIHEDDLCSLLFNLIDNAIEATQKTSENKIFLKMKSTDKILLIKISNPFNGVLDFETKKGNGHGQGIIIIREIIKHYNGIIDYSTENNMVNCNIQLILR